MLTNRATSGTVATRYSFDSRQSIVWDLAKSFLGDELEVMELKFSCSVHAQKALHSTGVLWEVKEVAIEGKLDVDWSRLAASLDVMIWRQYMRSGWNCPTEAFCALDDKRCGSRSPTANFIIVNLRVHLD